LRLLHACLATLFLSLSCLSADAPRLRYQIGRLSNARSVQPTAPGAAGTANSFLLVHERGNWARFNWPMFHPIPGLKQVRFHCRRDADGPGLMMVRFLGRDGTEWQSQTIDLTPEWQEHSLTTADFAFFRGDEAKRDEKPDLGDVIQFQVVPSSGGEGEGRFRLDQIRLEPGGPIYTADQDDLRPVFAPRELQRQRINDLLARWHYERRKLERDALQAQEWLRFMEPLATSAARAFAAGGKRSSDVSLLPWHFEPTPIPDDYQPLTAAAFDAMVRELAAKPVDTIDLTAEDVAISGSILYSAVEQSPPTLETEGGKRFLRLPVRFVDKGRQTVFLNTKLPAAFPVVGRRLEVDVRFPKVPLNSEFPLLLRLYMDNPDGESWADFHPDAMPEGKWRTLRFDVANPARKVRYTPTSVIGITFRLENAPGQAADFALDIGDVRLGWPPPEDVVRTRLLDQALAAVHQARLALYSMRDQAAAAEDVLTGIRGGKGVFLSPRGGHAGLPIPTYMPPGATGEPLLPEKITWRFRASPTGVAVVARVADPVPGARLVGEVVDGGERVTGGGAAANQELALYIPPPSCWSNRRPRTCNLQLAMVKDGRTLARINQQIQPGIVTVSPSPINPTLRHLRHRRQPDWTMRENGRAWFARMAVYNWSNTTAVIQEGHRLLDDLWVDGLRRYGLHNRPASWDIRDQLGVPFLHSLSPNYRSLAGWDDVAVFRDHYTTLFRMLSPHANRPFQAVAQAGNEVELSIWGASLSDAFPGALYQPLDIGAELLSSVYAKRSPVMYVRASSFRTVPPLPHEDISGINQYTGRYHGRQDEVARDLAELAREAVVCNRPLFITEWMGPKYSWATSGVGGVTRRGAAYYLERYWRAMIQTPGIVGSSEFTMNWVIAPFEDLTTQPREQAYKNRPKHSQFGGGRTADHVPLVGPHEAVRGPCFRSMQAFHSPLYVIANSPGSVAIRHSPQAGKLAAKLRDALSRLGKEVKVGPVSGGSMYPVPQHDIVLLHPDDPVPEKLPVPPADLASNENDEPLIRHRLNPKNPNRLLVALSAPSTVAYERGAKRLAEAASAMVEMNELEGAMSRVVALTDKKLRRGYERYLLELAARGHVFSGDDTREELNPTEFLTPDGKRRPAWEKLSAVILDTARELQPAEQQLVETLIGQGVHLVISLPCWQANPTLQQAYPVTLGPSHPLSEPLPVVAALRQPVPVRRLGGADLDVIRKFQPKMADSAALRVRELSSPTAKPLATAANGAAVALAWERGPARIVLLGGAIGEVLEVHGRVTRSGLSHRLYDRDTACGLERLSRFIVNCCRFGQVERAPLPRLFADTQPTTTLVPAGSPVQARVRLTNANGQPVPGGQLRVRVRRVVDGRHERSTDYLDIPEAEPGIFLLNCPEGPRGTAGLHYPTAQTPGRLHLVSLQFKAYAPGHIPADSALTVALDSRTPQP